MTNTERINFGISPKLKKDVECLANWHGKSLSAFMLDVCNHLVKTNAKRIKEQAQRENEPINFVEVVKPKAKKSATNTPPTTTDKTADIDNQSEGVKFNE